MRLLRGVALGAAAALLSGPAPAQPRAHDPVSTPPRASPPVANSWRLPSPSSVMWIGAHPDDEVLVAPLLAKWCLDGHARCTILTATRGEAGDCLLPGGCLPDVATVRSAEAGASSQLFGARLVLLTYVNGGVWPPGSVAESIASFVRAETPELVLAFDPRHGTTCNPEHLAIGAATLEAMGRIAQPPALYLLETRVTFESAPFAVRFSSASPEAIRFDANADLVATRGPAWNALLADMERHPSQFDATWLAAVRAVPVADRAVHLAPASTILGGPVPGCP